MAQQLTVPKATKALLNNSISTIQAVVGDNVQAKRMARMAAVAVSLDPKLARCSATSIVRCVVQAAALGLEVGTPKGEAYLVPYKDKCTLIPGYKGMVKQALRVPQVKKVIARCVYKGDEFEYAFGLDEKLTHVPCGNSDPNDILYAYAVVVVDGEKIFEVLTREEIEKRRKRSQSGSKSDSPWNRDYPAMCKKSAIRALEPYMPTDPKFDGMAELDNRSDMGLTTGYSESLDDLPAIDVDAEEVDGEDESEEQDEPANGKDKKNRSLDDLKKEAKANGKGKGKGKKKEPEPEPQSEDPEDAATEIIGEAKETETVQACQQFFTRKHKEIANLPEDWKNHVVAEIDGHLNALQSGEA